MDPVTGLEDGTSEKRPKPNIKDPDALAVLEAMEDPEDQEDLIDALEVLQKVETGGSIPWEETKKRLGL